MAALMAEETIPMAPIVDSGMPPMAHMDPTVPVAQVVEAPPMAAAVAAPPAPPPVAPAPPPAPPPPVAEVAPEPPPAPPAPPPAPEPAAPAAAAAATPAAPPAPAAAEPAAAKLPPGAQPKLVVIRGLKIKQEFPIYDGHNFIGRADEKPVDIDLEDQEPPDRIWCSRQHALITLEESALVIEDLNSANGTYVNRTRVYPGQKRGLNVNDVIQIGTVQMKVVI
jgi:hypothetical protein